MASMNDDEIEAEAKRAAGQFFGKYHSRLTRVHLDEKELASEACISIMRALAEGNNAAPGKVAWRALSEILRREETRLNLNDSGAPATAARIAPLEKIDWSMVRLAAHPLRGPSCNPSAENLRFGEYIAEVRASAIVQNLKNDPRQIDYETKAKGSYNRIASAQQSEKKRSLARELLDRSKLNAAIADAKSCLSPDNLDAVNSLPYRKQVALLLCDLLGLTQAEVGKIIGVTGRTVGNDLETAEIAFARHLQFGRIYYDNRNVRTERARWAA